MKSVSLLVRESLELYRHSFSLLGGLSAWLLIPSLATIFLSLFPNNSLTWGLFFVLTLLEAIISVWITATIFLTIHHIVEQKKEEMKFTLTEAWHLLPSLVFVGLLQTLAVIGGFILFVIPGIVLLIRFCFAQISVILDGKKGRDALVFSSSLVKGHFWEIGRRLLAGPLLFLVVILLISSLLILAISPLFGGFAEKEQIVIWANLITNIVEIFTIPLFLTYFVLLYKEAKMSHKPEIAPAS